MRVQSAVSVCEILKAEQLVIAVTECEKSKLYAWLQQYEREREGEDVLSQLELNALLSIEFFLSPTHALVSC